MSESKQFSQCPAISHSECSQKLKKRILNKRKQTQSQSNPTSSSDPKFKTTYRIGDTTQGRNTGQH